MRKYKIPWKENPHCFKKGNPGKPKGCKNKFTTLKAAFIGAFQDIGGQEALARFGKSKSKKHFYHMVAQMLPKDVTVSGNPDAPLQVQVSTIKEMVKHASDTPRVGQPGSVPPGVSASDSKLEKQS